VIVNISQYQELTVKKHSDSLLCTLNVKTPNNKFQIPRSKSLKFGFWNLEFGIFKIMGLFNRWFGGGKTEEQPDIQFGRYNDGYVTEEQQAFWKKSVAAYEAKNYAESFEVFFQYLQANRQNSVTYAQENGKLTFELLQGSKKVMGYADDKQFVASTKIVRSERLNVGFMRRLLEHNYALNYSRLSLDNEDNICMTFSSYLMDASPYKLYAALKELSTTADKQDDLLADEFEMLHPIETGHIIELPEAEKAVKYKYIKKWTDETFARIDELDPNKFKIGVNYLLLSLVYKMDYLVVPEGVMTETMEKAHHTFFSADGRSPQDKAQAVVKSVKEMMERPHDEFYKEMYRVPATFSITAPAEHAQLAAMIEAEMPAMDYYLQNNYLDLAAAIPGFVTGHFLFYFHVPQPDREYLHLLLKTLESDYFKELGFTDVYYDSSTQKIDKSGIKSEIQAIAKSNKTHFPKLAPNTAKLKYDNLPEFARSFLFMVKDLDLTPKEQ